MPYTADKVRKMKQIILDYGKRVVIALLCVAVLIIAMMLGAALSSLFAPDDEFCRGDNASSYSLAVRESQRDRYVVVLWTRECAESDQKAVSVFL